MNLETIMLSDLTDTQGAMLRLSARFNRPVSDESIRQYVKANKLHPLIFEQGVLVERTASAKTRGRDLFFLLADLDAMPEPKTGYPSGKPRR